jgi:hypothetical protein
MTRHWPILSKYTQAHWTLLGPTSDKRHQPTQALRRTVGMRQEWRQPIRRRRPSLIWMGVEEKIIVVK